MVIYTAVVNTEPGVALIALTCHVISQSKEFEEPGHHYISVRWWNTYDQTTYLSADNKEFDA